MNRGVISLSSQQRSLLTQLCEQFPETATPELVLRLRAANLQAQNEGQEVAASIALELTEDSAEAALDILPIPSPTEPEVITSLRDAFQTFLTQLRGRS